MRFNPNAGRRGQNFPFVNSEKAIEKLNWRPTGLSEGLRQTMYEMREQLKLRAAQGLDLHDSGPPRV